MAALTKEEVERRARMVEQELRIVNGGALLKDQLHNQIRDLHKSQFDKNPPPAESIEKIVNSLNSQIKLIENKYIQKDLVEYQQRVDDWLHGNVKTQEVISSSSRTSFTKPYKTTDKLSATHINFPIIPQLCRDENELFYELAAILSEMKDNYNPQVFLTVFFDSIQKYEDKYGTVDGFSDKVYQQCREHREFLKEIFVLFSTDAMVKLSQQLVEYHEELAGVEDVK